ncbi:MAG TPA: ADP-ribose pyrophosphatase [Ruminococcaceae bacterium]|nr:ADP-ribose pyrophosphatase [Oscillospiraceae bacterium]
MDLTEKPVKQDYIYKGKIVNLRVDDALLPNGTTAKREIVEHPGGVCVAALTDNNELMFVEQFRYPYFEVVLELPAGKLEYGEDPFEAGKRELREETGATASKYEDLGKLYPTPGYCGEIIHMYLAKNLSFGEQDLDSDEFLEVKKIPLEKAFRMVMNNEIRDSKTQVGIVKTYYKVYGEKK